jgi:predicted TIM-barrel fold metal-dependent hydrolase
MTQTRFANLLDLARLPYFEVRNGELCIADSAFEPAIDVHTHLALAYLTGRVDLRASHPHVEHYLAADRPIDLDVYINKNFTPADIKALSHDLVFMAFGPDGMRRTHTMPNLRREMAQIGVRQSVLLPIDFPYLSQNSERWLDVTRGVDDLVCFGSVHPLQPSLEGRLDALVRLGARGIKIHPAVQLVPPDHRRMHKLVAACAARKLPVLFHCGPVDIENAVSRRFSQVYRYEQVIAEHPTAQIVLGHSGALQMEDALAFCKRYPNVWLESSSQSLTNVRRIVDEAPPERVMLGSDWPFYHQATALAKVLLATEGNDAARSAVLHGNARALFA